MGYMRGLIGDPKLKKFKRGTLANLDQITEIEDKIFKAFTLGVQLKKIFLASKLSDEQKFYDIIRKVGYYYQEIYCSKLGNDLNNKDKLLFQSFVKGESLQSLTENWNLPPFALVEKLRHVGELYYSYKE